MIEIRELTEQFVAQVTRHVEERTRDRWVDELCRLDPDEGRRPGIRGKHERSSFLAAPKGMTKSGRPRRKPPIRFCPAPRCKNRAAPVYGMLCSTHKDLPKAKVRKYREARKAKKAWGRAA